MNDRYNSPLSERYASKEMQYIFSPDMKFKTWRKLARAMGMPEADKPEDFLAALAQLQEACGVADLKMSDYGIRKDECMALAINARETMGGLFLANPCPMSDEECAGVFARAYR